MKDDKFGFRLRLRLMEERKRAGGSLPWPEVERVGQECYNESIASFSAVHPAPKKKRSMAGLPDDEWLAELESDPAFEGVDVKRELGKCQVWMKNRGRVATRRSFINWLLKAERTIGYSGTGRSSAPSAPTFDVYKAPENWREMAAKVFPNGDFSDKQWAEVSILVRKDILTKSQ